MENRLVTLVNANSHDEMVVDMALVFTFWYSRSYGATLIESIAGATFPVKESLEMVKNLKQRYIEEEKKYGQQSTTN